MDAELATEQNLHGRRELSMSNAENRSTSQPTVLGPACHIRGELVIDGDAVILGAVDGDIEAAGNLEIGPQGAVTGRVKATSVVVQGRINGPVHCEGPVEIAGVIDGDVVAGEVLLGASASLQGGLRARVLSIAEGAAYRGEVVIGPDAFDEAPEQPATRPAAATTPNGNGAAPAVEVSPSRAAVGNILRRRHELLRQGS
ncbi:MAG TPA: polymer-forming cytoskeletal protein [Phycisphaerales bacterium]|nr:polymer-forming cytoskeletal protein [Phycisphaerales bacterium]